MDCSTPGFPVHHQFPELPNETQETGWNSCPSLLLRQTSGFPLVTQTVCPRSFVHTQTSAWDAVLTLSVVILKLWLGKQSLTDARSLASMHWCQSNLGDKSFWGSRKKEFYCFARQRGTQRARASHTCVPTQEELVRSYSLASAGPDFSEELFIKQFHLPFVGAFCSCVLSHFSCAQLLASLWNVTPFPPTPSPPTHHHQASPS